MDEGDRGLFGGGDVPASAKEIDLIVRVVILRVKTSHPEVLEFISVFGFGQGFSARAAS